MSTISLGIHKEQKEKSSLLSEVANVEKQLWALILAKGILHSDVQALYHKICNSYDKIVLNDHEVAELQEVEYSLWKLHYRHIDEFRKKIKKNLANEDAAQSVSKQNPVASKRSSDNHIEGFKSFLLEASRFYKSLIRKVKSYYGLPEDFFFGRRGGDSVTVEPKKMQKLQFLCHRFLVCLGDLARYREQYDKGDTKDHNWSIAVTHYSEATKIWPHSGNPQNQLAVLATYVGDEFLALYHCIRSLAVREPFPDAWNNLILLFERNRSSDLHILSKEIHFDFLKPSKSTFQNNPKSTNAPSNCKTMKAEHEGSTEIHLWPLFIRVISFFFIKSSFEDFPLTFASAIKELDVLMALDDEKLEVAMGSYQRMDSTRSGPFRTLQVVSIFIFVIENLINNPEARHLKDIEDKKHSELTRDALKKHSELTRDALTAMFIFMGRLVDRCLKANILSSCPILPALLVFSEWLVSILDEVEMYGSNEESLSAMSYFFGTFLQLLKQFDIVGEVKPPVSVALWEDYEMRGFAPLNCYHASLDFSINWQHAESYKCGAELRAQRIIDAAIKITDRSSDNQKWIFYDKSGRSFYAAESNRNSDTEKAENMDFTSTLVEAKESHQNIQKVTEESGKVVEIGKSISAEEEEVILFKPLTRHNSAPIYSVITTTDQTSREDAADQTLPADECLRRATSLLIAQNQAQGDPSTFSSDLTNFRRNPLQHHQEPYVKDTVTHPFSEASTSYGPPSFSNFISSGPPSLNAWVLDGGSLSNDRAKGKREANKASMPPIQEISSASLDDLSISDTENSATCSQHESVLNYSPGYSAPVPSAPLLPEDASWLTGNQATTFSDYNNNSTGNINRTNNFVDISQTSGYANWASSHQQLNYGINIPVFAEGHSQSRRMTSSEWLRQYRENHNLEWTPTHGWPVHPFAAANTGNFYDHDMPRCVYQFGTPLASKPLIYEESPQLYSGFPPAYPAIDHRREKLYHGYPRPNAYGCGATTEPEPLLQYLKEKEWFLQQDPTLRGPAYMGS